MWEKFDKALKAKGVTQGDLEVSLGLAENRISKWKNKPENLSILDVILLARAVDIPVGYLVDDSQVESSSGKASVGLPDDQFAIIQLYIALKLSPDEALIRLAGPGAMGTAGKAKGEKADRPA